VSLDISNAFNNLPWKCIKAVLCYHRVPRYLRHLIGDYIRDRCIMYKPVFESTVGTIHLFD